MGFIAEAMHKAKSPSQAHKILPKKWRPKSKTLLSSSKTCLWSPSTQGAGEWSSMSGRRVQLNSTNILYLSEVERLTLQKIALSKLQEIDLGVPVVVPKDSSVKRHRRSLFHKRRTNSGNLSGLLDNIKDNFKDKSKTKETKEGYVFNIPLAKCIANDTQLRRRRHSLLKERRESLEIPSPRRPRKSSSSSTSSTDNHTHNGNNVIVNTIPNDFKKRQGSTDSLSESESSRNTTSSLLDALSLSSSTRLESVSRQRSPSLLPSTPQVPYIVNTCFKHLETYGLQVLGIFRVGSSKKRTKQLREEFDTGKDVKLNEEHNPHDVGALLKEFFRDLPEPLLTRDLYSPFVATRKIKERERRLLVTQLLVSLLPVASRDTLWALLKFLYKVVQHSKDTIDENSHEMSGNKMDSHNLATLFGPNVLHKAKSPSEKEFQVETMERAEERKEVIGVIREMIDESERIFEIPVSLHDEIYRVLWHTNPEATDHLLKKKSNDLGIEPDPDTSSSHFEESDTSSIPRSPNSDVEYLARPKSLAEALAMQSQHRALGRVRSADTPSIADHNLQVPAHYRLSTPDGLLRGDTRTPSPMAPSPMSMSPSPQAARHPPAANLRIQVTPEYGLSPTGGAPVGMSNPPPGYSCKVGPVSKNNSSSTLSSNYASTASNSPGTPDSPGWSCYGSLPKNFSRAGGDSTGQKDSGMNANHQRRDSSPRVESQGVRRNSGDGRQRRTSSTQRPLDISIAAAMSPPGGDTPSSADWQRERWQHWEQLAKKNDGANEQETLV